MMLISIMIVIVILLTWNIKLYTTKDGKDISVGRFILGISLIILGYWLLFF